MKFSELGEGSSDCTLLLEGAPVLLLALCGASGKQKAEAKEGRVPAVQLGQVPRAMVTATSRLSQDPDPCVRL